MKVKYLISLTIMVAVFVGISFSAHASTVTLGFSDSNNPIGGDLGDLVLTDDASGVLFQIVSTPSNLDRFYFNLTSPVSIDNINVVSSGKWKVVENKNASIFGKFDYEIYGGKKSNDPLEFHISGLALPGDTIPLAETLFVPEPNHDNPLFAGHLQGGESYVGRIAQPIPGAVWLLGSGLVGLVVVRRRVNK